MTRHRGYIWCTRFRLKLLTNLPGSSEVVPPQIPGLKSETLSNGRSDDSLRNKVGIACRSRSPIEIAPRLRRGIGSMPIGICVWGWGWGWGCVWGCVSGCDCVSDCHGGGRCNSALISLISPGCSRAAPSPNRSSMANPSVPNGFLLQDGHVLSCRSHVWMQL